MFRRKQPKKSRKEIWRSCKRKIKHKAWPSAAEHMARLEEIARPGEKYNIYYCPHCHGLHVGHKKRGGPPKKKRKKRRPPRFPNSEE